MQLGSQLPFQKDRQLTGGCQLPIMKKQSDSDKRRPGLKALRESAGLTQLQLAHAVNVHEKAVRGWENTGAIPSFDKAVALSKVLKVSLARLAVEFGLGGDSDLM
jgi:DNA-binding XRE family transcriptional regulator